MKKYFALFCVPAASMQEWMANVPEATRKEQMDTMMKDWAAWQEKHKAAIIDTGGPLGKTKRVTSEGIADAKNDLNYYLVVQADSHEAAAELFKDNPHLAITSSYIEVMDSNQGM